MRVRYGAEGAGGSDTSVGNVLCQGEKPPVTSRRRNDTTDKPGCENTCGVESLFPLFLSTFFLLPVLPPLHTHTVPPPPTTTSKGTRPSPAHTLLLVSRRDSGVGQTVGERSRKPFPRSRCGPIRLEPRRPQCTTAWGGQKKNYCILLGRAEEEKWNDRRGRSALTVRHRRLSVGNIVLLTSRLETNTNGLLSY